MRSRRRRQTAKRRAEGEEEPREKVIVRSDGTVTYVGKDMAYQLWKFGLLGKDFHYRIFENGPPPLWSTTSDPAAGDAGRAAIRPRLLGVQRHRHAAVVSAEAAEAGAGRARLSANRRRIRSTTRTRWSRCRTPPRASSATTRVRTPTGRSSRSRAARGSA